MLRNQAQILPVNCYSIAFLLAFLVGKTFNSLWSLSLTDFCIKNETTHEHKLFFRYVMYIF